MRRRRRPELLALALAALAAAALFLLLGARRGPAFSPERASWTVTPGVLNPQVAQDTIAQTICVDGWTSSIRPPTEYTNRLKLEQMETYQREGEPADYQEDHLISLGLGGHPTDPRNLWPQPIEQALRVDRVERDLHETVCSGRMALAEAQRRISELKHTEG
ncbi:MAG: hypothetical protein WD981_01315 [Gaiellaceae bacterium]